MTYVNSLLIGLLVFCFNADLEANFAKAQTSVLIEGRVSYPDGSPAGGSHILAETDCANTSAHLAQEATANRDGKFSIRSFDPTCNRYKFSVSHRENFWLPTGNHIFYIHSNGTNPTIELMSEKMPAPVLLRLKQRGGEIELRVFDRKTQSFIYAGLGVHREPVANRTFGGGMSTATGDDGSSRTLFLPPGNYVAKVDRYKCHGKNYFSAKPPKFRFSVKAGLRQAITLKVNSAEILAKSSYDNPGAARCFQ